jgi:hypothetical protein
MNGVAVYFNDLPEFVELLRVVDKLLAEFWGHCGLLVLSNGRKGSFVLAVLLGSKPSFIMEAEEGQCVPGVRVTGQKLTIAKGAGYPRPTSDETSHLHSFNLLEVRDDLN